MDQQGENLPLNLPNHYWLTEKSFLGFGERVYALNDTDIELVRVVVVFSF